MSNRKNFAQFFNKLFNKENKQQQNEELSSTSSPQPMPSNRRLLCTNSVVSPAPKKLPVVLNCVKSRRLMKEFEHLSHTKKDPVFCVELINDNLFEWHVKLFKIDCDSQLYSDMKELNVEYILLHLSFPDDFPFAPPFMRVVSPRIEKGFVMDGGAICMELLTPKGWASAYTIEAIIMQFAASLVKGQGRIQRNKKGYNSSSSTSSISTYSYNSRLAAESSFKSLVKTHDKYGWVTPSLADG